MSISSATSSALQSATTALNALTKKMTHYEQFQELLSRGRRLTDSQTNIQVGDAKALQSSSDANKDGVVSKDELSNTVNQLNKSLADKTSSFYSTGKGEQLAATIQNSQFSQQLLSNFDVIANLDGEDGISQKDINKLAAQHGNNTVISGLDIYKAASSDGYADMQNQEAQFRQTMESKYGVVLA